MSRAREAENKFIKEQNELDIDKTKEMAAIETEKFQNMVKAIGSDTLASIATAGPEMQVCVCVCVCVCIENSGGSSTTTDKPYQCSVCESIQTKARH